MKKKPGLHFHNLRHGFATHALNCDVKIETIQQLLGHTDIGTTMVYLHMNPKKYLAEYEEKVRV